MSTSPQISPLAAIEELQREIQKRGPDTANRHYGRRQWNHLMRCCDVIYRVLEDPPEEVDVDGMGPADLLALVAEEPLEDLEDVDAVQAMWLTADDIANRLRGVLVDAKLWWTP